MSFTVAAVPVVMDASFAVESLGEDPRFREAWSRWIAEGAETFAPSHFWAEVANAFLRSGRLLPSDAAASLGAVADAGIDTIDNGLPGIRAAMGVASDRGLTVYDALYLELALDIDARLATLDRALARAAEAEGVELVAV